MRQLFAAIIAAAGCVWGAMPFPAIAGVILDQSNIPTNLHVFQARSIDYQGQTFTVGLAGTLWDIRVDVGDYNVPPQNVDFYLAPIVANTALFSASYHLAIPSDTISPNGAGQGPAYADWLDLDFSPFQISVAPGDQFALVFHSAIPFEETGGPNAMQVNWFTGNPGAYDRGSPIDPSALIDSPVPNWSGYDAGFETYVSTTSVPEASSISLVFAGLGLLALVFGNKHRQRG